MLGFALFGCLLSAITHPSAAATRTVTNTNDSGAGSLRQAIDSAAPTGDLIVFAAGVEGTIALTSGELFLNKNVTIAGPGAVVLTISGNNLSRVFKVGSVTAAISGLRISDGRVTGNPSVVGGGAGIFNNNGNLTVQNCEIVNNTMTGTAGSSLAGQGGGVYHIAVNTFGWLRLQGCFFAGNKAIGGTGSNGAAPNGSGNDAGPGQGGGLFVHPDSSNQVTLEDSAFSNNSALGGAGGNGSGNGARGRGGRGQGGAVFIGPNAAVDARRTNFVKNKAVGGAFGAGINFQKTNFAEGQGGAFYIAGMASITGCSLDENFANGGAGIENSALIGAPGQGGALCVAGGAGSLYGSTVFNNLAEGGADGSGGGATASGEGGGLFSRFDSGTFEVSNSTIVFNVAAAANSESPANGGGLSIQSALNITNSTIASNLVMSEAGPSGGGLQVSDGVTTLRNTLFGDNFADATAADASGPIDSSSSYNLIEAGDGVSGIADGSNNNQIGISSAPLDSRLQSSAPNGGPTNTCALEVGSPAIDAGNVATSPVADQRGYMRSSISDIGAFEFEGLVPIVTISSIKRVGSGPVVLDGLGVPNAVHRIQGSVNLNPENFFDLVDVPANGAGLLHHEDAPAGVPLRFYRLAFP